MSNNQTPPDLTSLIRLQAWLSPAFPTGAFSYSHGLEQAISSKTIANKAELFEWSCGQLTHGSGWNDAVFVSLSWTLAKDKDGLAEISELAAAMSISKERHLEAMAQGGAFLKAASAWSHADDLPDKTNLPDEAVLSVAVGAVCGAQHVDQQSAIIAYLHAYISNQIQAALRLMSLGQQAGVQLLADIEAHIMLTSEKALNASIDDLGSVSIIADMAAINHETLHSRIFRS